MFAANFPAMYSPGVSGVACSSSPTRSSPSRITLIPAAAATKNDISVATVTARICAAANSEVMNAFLPPTVASPDAMMIETLPVDRPQMIKPNARRQM
jgi:hypothetical protein